MAEAKSIAVLFPGIGYSCDRSLMYFTGKLAAAEGYELRTVPYGDFPKGVKGNRSKMEQSFYSAMEQAEKLLQDIDWNAYDRILFIGKSIGTIVASAYAKEHRIGVKSVLFTPLTDTYRFAEGQAVAFHGTADPWAETPEIIRLSKEKGIPIYLTEQANHSLETGDVPADVRNLAEIMAHVQAFLEEC